MAEVTKVYAWIQSGKGTDWVHGMAMDEHGEVVAEHISSSDDWACIDMCRGHLQDYVTKYGEGRFDLFWVDDPKTDDGLMAAYAKNQERRKRAEENKNHDN